METMRNERLLSMVVTNPEMLSDMDYVFSGVAELAGELKRARNLIAAAEVRSRNAERDYERAVDVRNDYMEQARRRKIERDEAQAQVDMLRADVGLLKSALADAVKILPEGRARAVLTQAMLEFEQRRNQRGW